MKENPEIILQVEEQIRANLGVLKAPVSEEAEEEETEEVELEEPEVEIEVEDEMEKIEEIEAPEDMNE